MIGKKSNTNCKSGQENVFVESVEVDVIVINLEMFSVKNVKFFIKILNADVEQIKQKNPNWVVRKKSNTEIVL